MDWMKEVNRDIPLSAVDWVAHITNNFDHISSDIACMDGDELIESLPFVDQKIALASRVKRALDVNANLPESERSRYIPVTRNVSIDLTKQDEIDRILHAKVDSPIDLKCYGELSAGHPSAIARFVSKKVYRSAAHLLENPTSGQPGHTAFLVSAQRLLTQPKDQNIGLLSIDVNNLKWVNDTIGHAAGDAYIAYAGKIIQEESAKQGLIAFHKSGDEFYIPSTSDEYGITQLAKAGHAIQKRLDSVLMQYQDPDTEVTHSIPLSCSAGIGVGPTVESSIHSADKAMSGSRKLASIVFIGAHRTEKLVQQLVRSGEIDARLYSKKDYKERGYRGDREERKAPYGYSNTLDQLTPVDHGYDRGIFGGLLDERTKVQANDRQQVAGSLDQTMPQSQIGDYEKVVRDHVLEEMDDLGISMDRYGIDRSDNLEIIFRKIATQNGDDDFKALQERIKLKMFTNPLTGAPNKKAYEHDLRESAKPESDFKPSYFVVGDINGLKPVNDDYGHAAGDAMLKAMAKCATRAAELISRTGAGEVRAYHPHGDEIYALAETKVAAELFASKYKSLLSEVEFSASNDKGDLIKGSGLSAGVGFGLSFGEADSLAAQDKQDIKQRPDYKNGIGSIEIEKEAGKELEATDAGLTRAHGRSGHGWIKKSRSLSM